MGDDQKTPPGVIALFIGPDGYVWGKGSYFARSVPGGYSLEDGQEYFAKSEMVRDVKFNVMNHSFARRMADYAFESAMDRMVREEGFRIHIVSTHKGDGDG